MVAHEMAHALGGRLPLDMLLHHAAELADKGHAVGKSEARYIVKEESDLLDLPFFKETFYIDGKRPAAGQLRRIPALAATLRHMADAGLDDFYRGDIGREIAADLERAGTSITRDDLIRYRASRGRRCRPG